MEKRSLVVPMNGWYLSLGGARSTSVWRVSALVFALVAASCTSGGEAADTTDRIPADSSSPTLASETLPPVEAPESVVSSVDAAAPAEPEEFAPPFDPATDPYFQRRSRPLLATDPTETWSIEVDRVTVPFVDTVSDVIVVRTVTPDDDQAIVAFNRNDGSVAWEFDPDQTFGSVNVVGDGVLATLVDPAGQRTVLLDGATGKELPVPSDDNLSPRGRFIGAVVSGTCNVRNYEPSTGELVGEFCPLGAGPETFAARVGDAVVEVDPLDYQPVSDPIPVENLAEQRRVMVFGDTVVTYRLSELDFLDRSGALIASIPDPDEIMLTPAGVGSSVLIVYDFDISAGIDVRTLTPVWDRPTFVDPFGIVDGEAFGTALGESSTEVFSLETGETRCVIDAGVVSAQNGFYERDGVAYDFDCAQRWAIDVGDEAEIHFIDSGIVTVERTDAGTTEIRHLS